MAKREAAKPEGDEPDTPSFYLFGSCGDTRAICMWEAFFTLEQAGQAEGSQVPSSVTHNW